MRGGTEERMGGRNGHQGHRGRRPSDSLSTTSTASIPSILPPPSGLSAGRAAPPGGSRRRLSSAAASRLRAGDQSGFVDGALVLLGPRSSSRRVSSPRSVRSRPVAQCDQGEFWDNQPPNPTPTPQRGRVLRAPRGQILNLESEHFATSTRPALLSPARAPRRAQIQDSRSDPHGWLEPIPSILPPHSG